MNEKRPRKAVSLLSGGLDSTLATKLVVDQGIEVVGLYLESPFGCKEDVGKVADALGIPLKIVDKGMAYIDLIRNPKYGYGKNMNPCVDCRIYMFHLAKKVMDELGADFLLTGEVLGQRPMSQRREAMDIIDRDSGMKGLVLRPLSAQHFSPTRPEIEGWVSREKLLNISGRGRSEQLRWAKALDLKEYSAPAGGCLLTDKNFSKRLSNFFEHNADPTMGEVGLLRYGRHFDLPDGAHVVIGRDQEENTNLWEASRLEVEEGRMVFFKPRFPAPVAVLSGGKSSSLYDEVGKRVAAYAKRGIPAEQIIEVICGSEVSERKVHIPARPPVTLERATGADTLLPMSSPEPSVKEQNHSPG
jgi:hypothetical protein